MLEVPRRALMDNEPGHGSPLQPGEGHERVAIAAFPVAFGLPQVCNGLSVEIETEQFAQFAELRPWNDDFLGRFSSGLQSSRDSIVRGRLSQPEDSGPCLARW